jgi:hypothetical protein
MKSFLAIAVAAGVLFGNLTETQAGSVIQHLLNWNSMPPQRGGESTKNPPRTAAPRLQEKMLIGEPAYYDPLESLPSFVIDRSATWVVEGRCLTPLEASEYYAFAHEYRPLVAKYLASSDIKMEEYFLLRAALRSGWTCWYIEARITKKANVTQ